MMLNVKDLSFNYGDRKVLDNISFSLENSQLVSILGANGAGKSTLFKCILQILKDYSGDIIAEGKNLKELNHHQRAELVAYIPQDNKSTFNFSVEEIVLMSTTSQSTFRGPRDEEIFKMENALKKVGISEFRHRGFLNLSGGERQLVLIARALAQNAKIIVMDEPTSNLDFGNQIHLMETVRELAKEGYLILLSTHNPDFALQYSDRVLIIHDGKIAGNGRANEIINDEILTEIYRKEILLAGIEQSNLKTCISKKII